MQHRELSEPLREACARAVQTVGREARPFKGIFPLDWTDERSPHAILLQIGGPPDDLPTVALVLGLGRYILGHTGKSFPSSDIRGVFGSQTCHIAVGMTEVTVWDTASAAPTVIVPAAVARESWKTVRSDDGRCFTRVRLNDRRYSSPSTICETTT
jgi:hypothetical protein